ncbi:extracellular catalytic domain type 1 short-chain-length polyhydroxyalkanoate depolymerase [Pseudochelatococcus contaminans]|uniref:Feruloyl esterase n=1 Tax=Pseudochelatococcus contaminans TaxID=1538103 RepID=A0A7W5Z3J2_9HYPH|nr:PHB depolymerase family esterase [Pseudochelatococcus contaminans]MBB3809500.1 feruloyl esterase [Pseudochelatococcus contaminans]
MTGIASTTANLALWRLQWETLFSLPHLLDESEMDDDEGCRLSEVESFGGNPGNLRMFRYVPDNLPSNAPLVVVLHGCTQTAAGYDRSSGWSWLAEQNGFAVLFAQQRGENNPRRCFNWFRPGDIARDSGEAASIRNMVAFMADNYDLDRHRIFVTGLSAGGAMSNAMLAAYPDVFAAGAILAGLPYRSAKTVHEALQVMLEGVVRSREAWGDEVRGASPLGDLAGSRIAMPWPRVAVWQGLTDDVVKPINAGEIVKQWTNVHGLTEYATEETVQGGMKKMRWRNADGEVLVEAIAIDHLGHAVPIDTSRADLHEQTGQHFADIRFSSTFEIARFFGVLKSDPPPRGDIEDDEVVVEEVIEPAATTAELPVSITPAFAALPASTRRARGRTRESGVRSRTGTPTVPVTPDVSTQAVPAPEPVTSFDVPATVSDVSEPDNLREERPPVSDASPTAEAVTIQAAARESAPLDEPVSGETEPVAESEIKAEPTAARPVLPSIARPFRRAMRRAARWMNLFRKN